MLQCEHRHVTFGNRSEKADNRLTGECRSPDIASEITLLLASDQRTELYSQSASFVDVVSDSNPAQQPPIQNALLQLLRVIYTVFNDTFSSSNKELETAGRIRSCLTHKDLLQLVQLSYNLLTPATFFGSQLKTSSGLQENLLTKKSYRRIQSNN